MRAQRAHSRLLRACGCAGVTRARAAAVMIETGTMTPKLIDFGLTKEVARCLGSHTLQPELPAQWRNIITPAYLQLSATSSADLG
jgi:hypothetical protein